MKTITGKVIAMAIVMSGIIFSQNVFAVCNTPTGQSTTAITSSSATLNWTAVSGSQGYNVRYRIVNAPSWTSTTASINSKAITGLTASSNYEWQVQNKCTGNQTSIWTVSATFTTLAPVCSVPTGLTTTGISSSGATLNWGSVSGAQSYNVQYRVVGAPTWTSTTSSTTSKTISSLTPSSNYEWQVQTNCGSSNLSAFSASSTFSTPAPPCNVPTGLSTTGISSSGATLNWGSVSGAQSYNVQYRVVGAPTWTATTSSTTSKTISSLTPSSNYEWQVQTNCGSSNLSAFSASSTFSTTAAPCNVPTGLSTTGITSADATLNWSSVSGAQNYNVQYRVVGAPTWTATTSSTTSKTISLLTPSSNYEWQVQTNCGSSNLSAFSASSTFSTTAAPCNVPTGLSSTGITSSDATLNWSSVSGAQSYNIQYRIVGDPSWTSTTSSTTSKTISSLTPSSNYEWQVQTDCGNSNLGTFSVTENFSTISSCNVPTGLSTMNITFYSADLKWTSDINATNHNVQYRVVGNPSWTSVTSSTAEINISSLTPGTSYEWQVQADCGNSSLSSFSSVANFSTPSLPVCTVPVMLSASSLTATSATLQWANQQNPVGYNIQFREVGASSWTTVTSTKTITDLSSLNPGATYEWQVQTDCGNSNFSAYSSIATFALLSHAPPVAASNAVGGNPTPSNPSSWITVFVSSGSTIGDEQIVHDWLVAHGYLK